MSRWRWLVPGVVLVSACGGPARERDGPLTADRYETLQLQPLALDSAARRGDTIPLTLGGEVLRIVLQPRLLVAPGCTVTELREQPVTTPCPTDLGTYSGGIANRSDWSQARLTFTPDGVIGSIRTRDDTWIIEPRRDTTPSTTGTIRHIAYRTRDVRGRIFFEGDSGTGSRSTAPDRQGWGPARELREDDDNRCDPHERPCPKPTGGGGTAPPPPPPRMLGIAMAADSVYIAQARLGTAFMQRQAAVLNMVDGMYHREGIANFQIVVGIGDPLNMRFTSSTASDLLNALLPAYAAANLDLNDPANRVLRGVSTAFLTSGKPPDGVILGLANQPGISGMAFQDFTFGVGSDAAAAIALKNWMIMAHELGHNYNGEHDDADWFCRFWFIFCWNSARTIMWPSYTFRTSPEFSRGNWDLSHNNRQRLRVHIPTRTP
ncbi:MAG: M12 family metallo-peptidase [Gemmatimonadales bacterium]